MSKIKFKSVFPRDIREYISKQKPDVFFMFVCVPDSDWKNGLKKDIELLTQMGMEVMGSPGSIEAAFIDDRGDTCDYGSPLSFAVFCYAELPCKDHREIYDFIKKYWKWKGFAYVDIWKDGEFCAENV